MGKKKKITIVVSSCADCPFGMWDMYRIWCKELHKHVEPSYRDTCMIRFDIIPEDCPFPNTNKKVSEL